ncbi:hypothetical protein VNO77_14161 [Canavalia gladiata]|uniref:Uncharacterized protein n=1 Tax=Canavalia gladiata TaxID=3824 RepID=A0AAN9QRW8_CANGL
MVMIVTESRIRVVSSADQTPRSHFVPLVSELPPTASHSTLCSPNHKMVDLVPTVQNGGVRRPGAHEGLVEIQGSTPAYEPRDQYTYMFDYALGLVGEALMDTLSPWVRTPAIAFCSI